LAAFKLRSAFKCPNCEAPLRAELGTSIAISIGIWLVFSALFLWGWGQMWQSEGGPEFLFRTLIDGVAGLIIYNVVVRGVATISKDEASS
jgi:hypothetical protein